jgi:hypothetical protein
MPQEHAGTLQPTQPREHVVKKQLKALGLAFLAIFALSAVATATASAEELPELLPNPAKGQTFTSKTPAGVNSILETTSLSKIECTAATNKGEFTSAKTGVVTVDFTGCKAIKGETKSPCTSPGDAKETILLDKAGFQLVDVLLSNILLLGLLVLVPALLLAFECGLLKVLVLGPVIGVAESLKELQKTKEVTFTFKQTKGEQGEKTCMAPKVPCVEKPGGEFLLKTELGKSEELSGEATIDEVTFEKEYEAHF